MFNYTINSRNKILLLNYLNTLFIILLSSINILLIVFIVFFGVYLLSFKLVITFYFCIIISFFLLFKYLFKNFVLFSKIDIFRYLDESFSNPKGLIINAFTIQDTTVYSKKILESLFNKSTSIINNLKFTDLIINLKVLRINYFIFIILFALLSLTMHIAPEKLLEWSDLIFPQNTYELQKFNFLITPSSLTVNEGDNLKIKATRIGKPVELTLYINYYFANKPDELVIRELSTTDKTKYEFEFFNITDNITFYLTSDNYKSSEYKIKTIISPHITLKSVNIIYPEYTNKFTENYSIESGNINVLKNSKVKISGTTNFSITKAEIKKLNKPEDEIKNINFNDNDFSYNFTVTNGFEYYFIFYGHNVNTQSLQYEITSIEDIFPSIEIIQPEKHFTVTEDMLVPISILAEDDFGIDTIGISYIIDNEFTNIINLSFTFKQDLKKYASSYLWDIETLNIVPGSNIDYFAFAYDNDIYNNHKYTRTDTYTIRIPSLTDLFQVSMQKPHSDNRFIEQLNAKQSELVRETKSALNEIRRKNLDDWQVQQELKNLYDKQMEIKDNINEIKKGIEETVSHFNKRNLIDYSILERVSKIQKLLQDIVDEELMKNIHNLQKAIDSQNITEQEKQLMQAQFNMENFMQRLDDTIKTLQRFNTMKNLNIMKNLYNELSQEQNKTTKDLIESDNFDKAFDKQEQMDKDLDTLNDMLENIAAQNEQLAEELSNFDNQHIKETNQQLMKMLAANDTGAFELSRKLSQQIFDMQQKLNNLFENEQMTGVLNAQKLILEIVRELLFLTDEFENYKKKILVMQFENLIEKYRFSFLDIINVYQEIGRETLFLNFDIIKEFYSLRNKIIDLENKIKNKQLHNEIFELSQLQIEKLKIINILLKEKDDLMSRFQEAGGQSSMQNFEQLTSLQSLLNSFHQGLSFNPGMEMMQQLAYEQSLIRQMMQQIENQQNKYQSLLGDLSETIEKMKNVESELENYSPSTEKKKAIEKEQEEIVQRMLNYSQAMESDKEPEEEQRQAAHLKKELEVDDSILHERLKKYQQYLEKEKLFEKYIPKIYLEYVRNYLLNK